MEVLRFGSSIPGGYFGCCAADNIQNFKVEPGDSASIQLVSGDSGSPTMLGSERAFLGTTWRDIFQSRIRIGTFDTRDMPNHAFFAILTDWQIKDSIGLKWLKILKENGFEFIRTVANSVYTGNTIANDPPTGEGSNLNHVFALFRNIGTGAPADPFTPPKEWTDLPKAVPEAWQIGGNDIDFGSYPELAAEQFVAQKAIWEASAPAKIMKESEVVAAGAPVTLAGLRVAYAPPMTEAQREEKKAVVLKSITPKAPEVSLKAPKSEAKKADVQMQPVAETPWAAFNPAPVPQPVLMNPLQAFNPMPQPGDVTEEAFDAMFIDAEVPAEVVIDIDGGAFDPFTDPQ